MKVPFYKNPITGQVYSGDRQISNGQTFDPIVPDPPSPTGYTYNGTQWVQNIVSNWSGFRIAMMSDNGYKRLIGISNLSNNLLTQDFKTAMAQIHIGTGSPNVPVVQSFWNQIIGIIPLVNKPLANEIAIWNQHCTTYGIPFKFDSNGLIILN